MVKSQQPFVSVCVFRTMSWHWNTSRKQQSRAGWMDSSNWELCITVGVLRLQGVCVCVYTSAWYVLMKHHFSYLKAGSRDFSFVLCPCGKFHHFIRCFLNTFFSLALTFPIEPFDSCPDVFHYLLSCLCDSLSFLLFLCPRWHWGEAGLQAGS